MKEKAIITVIGTDKVGIVYYVSKILYENEVNILDISQKVFTDDIFSMVMMVELPEKLNISELREKLKSEKDLEIYVKGLELFNSMYKI